MIIIPEVYRTYSLDYFPLKKLSEVELKEDWTEERIQKEKSRILKIALLKGWNTNGNFKYNDTRLINYLNEDRGYGIRLGKYVDTYFYAIDIDDITFYDEIKHDIPNTRIVKSGSGEGLHILFFCDEQIENYKNSYETKEGKKERFSIRGEGRYIVGENSPHISGNKYEVFKDTTITKISKSIIEKIIQKAENKQTLTNIKQKTNGSFFPPHLINTTKPKLEEPTTTRQERLNRYEREHNITNLIFSRRLPKYNLDLKKIHLNPIKVMIVGISSNMNARYLHRPILDLIYEEKYFWYSINRETRDTLGNLFGWKEGNWLGKEICIYSDYGKQDFHKKGSRELIIDIEKTKTYNYN